MFAFRGRVTFRRRWIVIIAVLLLTVIGGPFLNVRVGAADEKQLPHPAGTEILVGGFTAKLADSTQAISTGCHGWS